MAADSRLLLPAAPSGRAPLSQHWSIRLRDFLYTYLPLLLMLVLAGATWWLVRMTPLPPVPNVEEPSAQAPDYVLMGVDLQRYRGDGTQLARIQGRELRHFPQGDRMELDDARILLNQADGPMSAVARHAEVTDGGDRVRLTGAVVLNRPASAVRAAMEVRGEEIEVDVPRGRAWSVRPVEWKQGGDAQGVMQAAGFEYRQETDQVLLNGPVRAQWRAVENKRR